MRKLENQELERLDIQTFKKYPKNPLVLIMDDVRSLNNVGSAFRTADAFLLEKIYLCGITGSPPHREINKTALGSTESVSWEYVEDVISLIQNISRQGYKIVVVEQTDSSVMLMDFSPDTENSYALVFGNEVFGVNQDLLPMADHCVEIPQYGTKHSLNISVSIGIVVWSMLEKMNKLP
ncbi:MAG: RNA methyltransferase [Cyclobacteriaceae bacterium]|nr:MAG: RNA methyltransferase [Cyclobacteriaceae bacterium]